MPGESTISCWLKDSVALRAFPLVLLGLSRFSSVTWGEECDVAAAAEADCNGNGVLDSCDLAPRNFGLVVGESREAGPLGSNSTSEESLSGLNAADLDGDGRLDLATSNRSSGTISIFWNQGSGTHAPQEVLDAGPHAVSLVAADFDGDGAADLAVANVLSDEISVLWNERSRSFSPRVSFPAGSRPDQLLAADVNGDALPDLLASASGSISLVVDHGDRSFAAFTSIFVAPISLRIGASDLDSDGDVDLAVTARSFDETLQVFLNDGVGVFQLREMLAVPLSTTPPLAGDLNSDGLNDLILGSATSVLMLIQQGGGRFGVRTAFELSSATLDAPTAADLNGDGNIDLALMGLENDFISEMTTRRLIVLLGNGMAEFQPGLEVPLTATGRSESMAPADLDGDEDLDLAISFSGYQRGRITVLENEPLPTSLDCDLNGIPDECDGAKGAPGECSGNGVPTVCEPDCNGNSKADDCDIAQGRSADCDQNGVPDECESSRSFILSFRGPERLEGGPGTAVKIPCSVLLHSCGLPPGVPGVQGWFVFVRAENAVLSDATTRGTAAGAFPEGLRKNGFERTSYFKSDICGPAIGSAVVLSFLEPVTLDAGQSPHEILKLSASSSFPQSGSAAVGLDIGYQCGNAQEIEGGDGQGGHGVAQTSITVDGRTLIPRARSYRLELVAVNRPFRRGDSNGDGRVDLSDAIREFMYLFLGASEPPCVDAADTTDDARIDLSDGIAVLNEYFREGTAIPAPGPFVCGLDPTPDVLTCAEYELCR